MSGPFNIAALDFWPIRIPLATPYHLSAVLGTLTHAEAVIVRITLSNGIVGWGECDPHAAFDGYTLERACSDISKRKSSLIGQSVEEWVLNSTGINFTGTSAAAIDVACYDAYAKAIGSPLWKVLGERRHEALNVLWPTSSGTAQDDLKIIRERYQSGFKTFMLKMGSRPISDELNRLTQVFSEMPADVQIMVDANQGWSALQAEEFIRGSKHLPLILVEQPLPAIDLLDMSKLVSLCIHPISADEAVTSTESAERLISAGAADVISVKISKHGGLANALLISKTVKSAGKQILMNSMIEFGITQAASLHLGITLSNLLPCGHAYMSTLRMSDDVTNFSNLVTAGKITPSTHHGLGIEVSLDKILQYEKDIAYE